MTNWVSDKKHAAQMKAAVKAIQTVKAQGLKHGFVLGAVQQPLSEGLAVQLAAPGRWTSWLRPTLTLTTQTQYGNAVRVEVRFSGGWKDPRPRRFGPGGPVLSQLWLDFADFIREAKADLARERQADRDYDARVARVVAAKQSLDSEADYDEDYGPPPPLVWEVRTGSYMAQLNANGFTVELDYAVPVKDFPKALAHAQGVLAALKRKV